MSLFRHSLRAMCKPTLSAFIAGSIAMLVFCARAWSFSGELDPNFGTGGLTEIDISPGAGEKALAVARQSDGKYVAAGNVDIPGGDTRLALVRLLYSGTIDTTFGTNGIVVTDLTGNYQTFSSVAVQKDGNIVASGFTLPGTGTSAMVLARYTPAGALDQTFGAGGLITSNPSLGTASALVIQPDGKLVVAGRDRICCGMDVARYLTNGQLDPSFGSAGIASFKVPNRWYTETKALLLQPDGKLVVGGAAGNPSGGFDNVDFVLLRLNDDGTLDTGFGNAGFVTTDFFGGEDEVHALALQPNGSIVAGGVATNGSNRDFGLARYNSSGDLNVSFGTNGLVTIDFGTNWDWVDAVLAQKNGKIIAAGAGADDFTLVRYNVYGKLDATFGNGGIVTTGFTPGPADQLQAALLDKGKVVAVGSTYALSKWGFARYLAGESYVQFTRFPLFDPDWWLHGDPVPLVFGNLLYTPAKLGFAAVGAATGALVYVATLGQSKTPHFIWRGSVGGDYFVTPRQLKKGRAPRFVGKINR
jgi:uncharacterized delta-60 repeat protein